MISNAGVSLDITSYHPGTPRSRGHGITVVPTPYSRSVAIAYSLDLSLSFSLHRVYAAMVQPYGCNDAFPLNEGRRLVSTESLTYSHLAATNLTPANTHPTTRELRPRIEFRRASVIAGHISDRGFCGFPLICACVSTLYRLYNFPYKITVHIAICYLTLF